MNFKNLNKATHLFFQAHSGVAPLPICTPCANSFDKSNHSHWDFVSEKPLKNRICVWCRFEYRQKAYNENRILWHVYKNGKFVYKTMDKSKAYPKHNWHEYSNREFILK